MGRAKFTVGSAATRTRALADALTKEDYDELTYILEHKTRGLSQNVRQQAFPPMEVLLSQLNCIHIS